MINIPPPETHISVLLARNGAALIFQGVWKQALFLSREFVPRFIDDPERAAVLVIPPLAALTLQCYLALEYVDEIVLKQDLTQGDDFSLTMRSSREKAIRYYSNHGQIPGPRTLRAEGIGLVVSPKRAALIDSNTLEPAFHDVIDRPEDQNPDYRQRFAVPSRLLSEALIRALEQSKHSLT